MDETEFTMVVAGLDPVEHCGVDLHAQRLTVGFVHDRVEFFVTSGDRQADVGFVGEDLPSDHVAGHLSVDRPDFVARADSRTLGG